MKENFYNFLNKTNNKTNKIMSLVNMQGKFIVKASGAGGGEISSPSNVSISNKSSSGFTVSWNAVASAVGYKLDVATDSGFTSFVSGYNGKDVAGTSEAVTGLASNTTYYTRVRAIAAGSNSAAVSESTDSVVVSASTFSSLGNGLQAFYKLDDTTDASGNGNTLTNTGGVTFGSGKIGNAAVFNNSDFLTNGIDLSIPDVFSISCWLKKPTSSGARIILSVSHTNGPLDVYAGPSHGNGLQATFDNANSFCDLSLPDNEWTHFVFIRNKTTNESKIYLNGVDSYTSSAPSFSNQSGISIGSSFGSNSSDGQVDAVGIWNRALTSGEIAELYNSGNGKEVSSLLGGLLAFYKLDDTTDASGNGNTLTNNGSVTFSSGKIGNAADFDGSNSKYLTSTSNLGQITGSGFSFSVWFKKTNGNNNVVASSEIADQQGWFLATNNDNNIYFLAGTGSWSTFDIAGTYSVDTWTHIAITSTSGGSVSYYVNGSLIATNNSVTWAAAPLCIGKNIIDNTPFGGQIDAVGIWNRPLNGTEVSELYNSGSGLE